MKTYNSAETKVDGREWKLKSANFGRQQRKNNMESKTETKTLKKNVPRDVEGI